ncbi:MAG: family HAD-type hydrolase [Fibrobacteres bacterium]|nr:family HAD-type hydrolase [Fibrobacterota bacterium]
MPPGRAGGMKRPASQGRIKSPALRLACGASQAFRPGNGLVDAAAVPRWQSYCFDIRWTVDSRFSDSARRALHEYRPSVFTRMLSRLFPKNGKRERPIPPRTPFSTGQHKEQIVKGRGFIIDMDGVIYRDATPIPGAVEFINRLVAGEVPFMFVTNNSQRTRRDVCHKLRKMGMNVGENHVFTCAMATARFISEKKPNGTAYVIGEGGLLQALHLNGYTIVEQDPDFVIIGEGRTFSAESMEKAVNLVLGGASLIATNLDPNCPTKTGTRPGCGAMVSMLEKATGIQAFSVGKPSPVIMRMARKEMGLRTKSVTVIGDTMETDILGGVQMGYRTILVLTGGTKAESLPRFAYRPDLVIPSIAHLLFEEAWLEEVGDAGLAAEEDFSMARPEGSAVGSGI